jgi:hypothetical protein
MIAVNTPHNTCLGRAQHLSYESISSEQCEEHKIMSDVNKHYIYINILNISATPVTANSTWGIKIAKNIKKETVSVRKVSDQNN